MFSAESGLFEPCVALGSDVKAGDILGALHFPQSPDRDPLVQRATADGVVVAHRAPAHTKQGDILFCIGHDVSAEVSAELNGATA